MIWVVDRHKFRRESIVAYLARLVRGTNAAVRDVEDISHILPESIAEPSDKGQQICLLGIGGKSLDDPAVHSDIGNLRRILGKRPLVLLVEQADTAMCEAAQKLGIRGIVVTSMPGEVVFAVLEHVSHGEAYFPDVEAGGDPPAPVLRPPAVETAPPGHMVEPMANLLPSHDPHDTDGMDRRVPELTGRQEEVLTYVCAGHSNKVIARKLGVSEATVKVHVRQVLKKFNATNRTQVAIQASRAGISGAARPEASSSALLTSDYTRNGRARPDDLRNGPDLS